MRGPTPEQQWFAVWVRSRHEQVVREQLEQKHFEAFLPTITRWSRWKDRKKKIDWPLFPGYCFARFNPRERLPILKCTGVVSIISFEGEPAPIHGPLRGVIGRLMRKDAQRARLVLSVDLIGQAVSVEVDAADVKPY